MPHNLAPHAVAPGVAVPSRTALLSAPVGSTLCVQGIVVAEPTGKPPINTDPCKRTVRKPVM